MNKSIKHELKIPELQSLKVVRCTLNNKCSFFYTDYPFYYPNYLDYFTWFTKDEDCCFVQSKNKKSMWSVFFVKIYPGVEDCQSLLLRFISVMIKFLWNHNNKWKVLTCQYPTWMENYKSKEFSGSIHTKEQSQKVVYRKYNFHLANNPLVKTWGRKY